MKTVKLFTGVLWKNCSDKFYKKASMRQSLFNKVSRLRINESLLHRCFPVSFTKYFRTLFLQNTSGWLLLLNTHFCSLRRPQPQKMFPSTFAILNIFETNTVNCLRTALCGGPRQTVSCDYMDLLLIEQIIWAYFIKWTRTRTFRKSRLGSLEKADPIPKFTVWVKDSLITNLRMLISNMTIAF